ncbi:CDP-diacylglycerol--serine O-phosphatidyltransferase [Sphingobacterium sp. SGG-5]|nr:CDP-diacylglycerol--serine O-phosphatidyltransferase [Sphingobacterium sp. SGG-5]
MAFYLYMKKYIPNTVTCLNLFSGCIGILLVLKGDYYGASYCVIASGVFDFFDGLLARALHVKSLIGKELDSLADVISFGFLPGVLMYTLLQKVTAYDYLPYAGFLITIFSALRLAKFNLDKRQTSDFIGVNTPMNTFLILSLPFIGDRYPDILLNVYVLLFITAVSSLLLVSELRLFSMKMISWSWKDNRYRYMFLIVSVGALIVLKVLAIPLIFVLYLLFSWGHFSQERPTA